MLLYIAVVCAEDNWALIYAQLLALAENLPLQDCFWLVPRYLEVTHRQYNFMLKGLREVAKVQKYYISTLIREIITSVMVCHWVFDVSAVLIIC